MVGRPGVLHFPLNVVKEKQNNLCRRFGLDFNRYAVSELHLPQSNLMFCLNESNGGGSVAVLLMKNAVNGVSQQRTFPAGYSARPLRSFMHWGGYNEKEMVRQRTEGHLLSTFRDF